MPTPTPSTPAPNPAAPSPIPLPSDLSHPTSDIPHPTSLLNSLLSSGFNLERAVRSLNLSALDLLELARNSDLHTDLTDLHALLSRATDLHTLSRLNTALDRLGTLCNDPEADPVEHRRAAAAIVHLARPARTNSTAPHTTDPDDFDHDDEPTEDETRDNEPANDEPTGDDSADGETTNDESSNETHHDDSTEDDAAEDESPNSEYSQTDAAAEKPLPTNHLHNPSRPNHPSRTPQDPGPQDPGPEDSGPEDSGPQNPGPQDSGPQDPRPHNPDLPSPDLPPSDLAAAALECFRNPDAPTPGAGYITLHNFSSRAADRSPKALARTIEHLTSTAGLAFNFLEVEPLPFAFTPTLSSAQPPTWAHQDFLLTTSRGSKLSLRIELLRETFGPFQDCWLINRCYVETLRTRPPNTT